jgi:hypothetical protein
MSQKLFPVVVFGPRLVLSVAFGSKLIIWHIRLNSSGVEAATTARITRPCKLFASVIKNFGWAYLLAFILAGALKHFLHRE